MKTIKKSKKPKDENQKSKIKNPKDENQKSKKQEYKKK